MDIFTTQNGLCRTEFVDGPHVGQIKLHADAGGQPPDVVGETIEATGETAWYGLTGGHGIPGLVTFTYAHKLTVPAAA
jgi:hypothetical protein